MDGSKITAERERLGLTQAELASKVNVSQKSISKYERSERRPTYETLMKMADLFGVSVDYLLGKSNDKFSNKDEDPANISSAEALKKCVQRTGFSYPEIARKLGISQDLLEDYLSGSIAPPYNILISLSDICEVSTDCLLGLRDGSRAADLDNVLPFRYNYRIAERIRSLCEKEGITQEYLQALLSLSENEVYYLIEYGFVPHISTVTKLADFFGVSCDYLLCQIGDQDEKAAMAFRMLNEDNKDIIVGEIKKALLDQRREGAVAAEMPLKEAK